MDALTEQLEDLNERYEVRLKDIKVDLERRLRIAEEKYMDADLERKRLLASRDTLQRELSKTQVEMEEKLANQERRLRAELTVQREAEADELHHRVKSLQQVSYCYYYYYLGMGTSIYR